MGIECFRHRDVAVDAGEALATLDDLLGAVEAALGEQRREHTVGRRLAGVERLAHGAAVLLHAGGLRRCDPHRVSHALRVELE
jgi:hypothetical protein